MRNDEIRYCWGFAAARCMESVVARLPNFDFWNGPNTCSFWGGTFGNGYHGRDSLSMAWKRGVWGIFMNALCTTGVEDWRSHGLEFELATFHEVMHALENSLDLFAYLY